MKTAPPKPAQLPNKFHLVCQHARGICESLERGQAETPLAAHFHSLEADLEADLETAPFGLVVFGVSRDSTERALGWLGGRAPETLPISVPEGAGVLEIELGDGDASPGLERSDGSRREFEDVESLLETLRVESVPVGDGAASLPGVARILLPAPEGLHRTCITLPEYPTVVTEKPSVLGRLVKSACVLTVVAPDDHVLSETEKSAIDEILSLVDSIWPVILTDEEDLEPKKVRWCRDVAAARAGSQRPLVLAPWRLSKRELTPFPDMLTDPSDPLRQALVLSRHARRLGAAAHLVADRHEEETRQRSAKLDLLGRDLKVQDEAAKDQSIKLEVERARSECQDELARLAAGIGELNRKAMLTTGDLMRTVQDAAAQVEPDDLESETRGSSIRLTVHQETLDRLAETTKQALRAKLHEDMIFLRDGVELVEEMVSERLEAVCGERVALGLGVPDEAEIWEVITEMVNVEISYRGEMPKRGFLQRLVAGRRQVYMILMSVSMFGGAFGVSRTSPSIRNLFLGLFICGVIYTFSSWRREDRERIEKELDRVKDSLSGEVKRILTEVNREKLSRISAHLGEISKEALRKIDASVREVATRKSAQIDQSRLEVKTRVKNLELENRERQSQGQSVSKLKQMAQELEMSCRTARRDAARAAK